MKCVVLWALGAATAAAQLLPPNPAGVTMGHIHLTVRDVAAHKAFWSELGGTHAMLGRHDYYKFPGVQVFLRAGEPGGGSEGSALGHLGFRVRSLSASLEKWKRAGIAAEANANRRQAFLTAPDGVRVEITEDASLTVPIAHHHIHWYAGSVDEVRNWYQKLFAAVPGKRGNFLTADLPGVNLTFSPATSPTAPTKGRALDHVGFEVHGLEAFCAKLAAAGIRFDVAYRKVPELGIAIAFLTDPAGTYLELTEGLSGL